jgi:quercetin dioxygenase-like cupin family protein
VINRIELSQETVELNGAPYSLQIAELVFGPHAETPLHTHPGPSSGYMLGGRITVSVPGENRTNTYSGDSAIAHPWDRPHRFTNPTDESVRMLSFELVPLTP